MSPPVTVRFAVRACLTFSLTRFFAHTPCVDLLLPIQKPPKPLLGNFSRNLTHTRECFFPLLFLSSKTHINRQHNFVDHQDNTQHYPSSSINQYQYNLLTNRQIKMVTTRKSDSPTTRQQSSAADIGSTASTTSSAASSPTTATATAKKGLVITAKNTKKSRPVPPPRRGRAGGPVDHKHASHVRKPNTKFTKKNADETVEVVKMLTGVLYLYRGERRRVEFVRKV